MNLPNRFDVIVIGTGLIESIVSAACSRSGKSVLHLDNNSFYGSVWASFNFDDLNNYLDQIKNTDQSINQIHEKSSDTEPNSLTWKSYYQPIRNIEILSYLIDEADVGEVDKADQPETRLDSSLNVMNESDETKSTNFWWTKQQFAKLKKHFCIDLCPRLLYSKGSMVDLLVSSNISRYLSFKNITRLVCVDQWKPIEIPFSRQSVFMSNDISLIEKRLLMRFMQVCVDKEKHADQLQEFANRPFVELMLAYKLTPLLQNLILDCIAFARDRNITSTMAIELVQRFATSTGVYGNTPFLVSTYGSGEIQQAFCRLSAVFGATYWLGNTIERVTFDGSKPQMRDNSNNEDSIEPSTPALTVQFDNSSIGCEYLVSGAACTPSSAVQSTIRTMLSRAILITDKSIKKIADKSMLNRESTQLVFSRSEQNPVPVSAIELSSTLFVCPDELYIVYLWCESFGVTAKADLLPVVKHMFNFSPTGAQPAELVDTKPSVLWSCYFNCEHIDCDPAPEGWSNHHLITSTPSGELDYDIAIREARNVFKRMYPDEEFLPRAPDPEEIVFEDPIVEDQPNGDQ